MPNQASAPARALDSNVVGRLARFFPDAAPVRIPVQLSCGNGFGNGEIRTDPGSWSSLEDTVIEFGTPREVLFLVKHRLEFADRLLVESKDGSLRAEASVVAAQYHPEKTVIAARFLQHVPNWIVKL